MDKGPKDIVFVIAHVLGVSEFQSMCHLGIDDVWGFPQII